MFDQEITRQGFYVESANYYFGQLVEIQVNSPSNDFSDGFDLILSLTVGDYTVSINQPPSNLSRFFRRKKGNIRYLFRVRLRNCKLLYKLDQCTILINSKYRRSVQAGSLIAEVRERFQEAMKFGANASIEGTAELNLVSLGAQTRIAGGVEGSHGTESAGSASAEIKPEIAIVEHFPSGWMIGHGALGDPLQATSQYCLAGTYFSGSSGAAQNTCRVSFDGQYQQCGVTLALLARGGFYVERLEDGGKARLVGSSEETSVVEEMRRHLAGMVVEKEFRETGRTNEEGELLLAEISARAPFGDGRMR